jgi:acyl-coenzyme A thioesterase PaaI-like protein
MCVVSRHNPIRPEQTLGNHAFGLIEAVAGLEINANHVRVVREGHVTAGATPPPTGPPLDRILFPASIVFE